METIYVFIDGKIEQMRVVKGEMKHGTWQGYPAAASVNELVSTLNNK